MSKPTVDIKSLFPLVIDGMEFGGLREAVRQKHPMGLEGYQTVYSRLRAGWPPYIAILLPARQKEG